MKLLPFALLALSLSMTKATFANNLFDPVIPRGLSAADKRADDQECKNADRNVIESFFGFTLATDITNYGRHVAFVDPAGPSNGYLQTGDLIVSVNGDLLVETDRDNNVNLNSFRPEYIDRGIYVYGLRGDTPFQAVIWSCAGAPEPYLFTSKATYDPIRLTYNILWPERHDGHTAPQAEMPLILAGLSLAQSSVIDEKYAATNPLAPKDKSEYCHRDDTVRINYTITRKTWKESNSGHRYAETSKTSEASLLVDRQFHALYRRNFDLIHNEESDTFSIVANSLRRTIKRFGCASPEFKDFERRFYRHYNARW